MAQRLSAPEPGQCTPADIRHRPSRPLFRRPGTEAFPLPDGAKVASRALRVSAGRAARRGVRRKHLRIPLHATLLVLWCGAAAAEGLRASLERNPIRADETVRLLIESEGAHAGAQPDLSPLDEDFERLGTSTSTQIHIQKGRQSATTRWAVELSPRRAGELPVPPLTLGTFSTPALTLRVLKAAAPGKGPGDDIFIESEVFPRAPYVQSQISYTLRLFRAVEILDGTLEEPRAADALVQRLGRDTGYTVNRGGRRYRVIERRYAIFPQSSGELHIPALRFDGEVADPGSGADDSSFGRLFMQGRRVRLLTPEYRLSVRARPAEFEGRTWLPARTLDLVEQWSEDPPELRVGEPLTRTLIVKAAGLRGDQLPELDIGVADGVRVYPDQPLIRTAADAERVYGSREQRFALVALRDGEVTLPEIRVRWWNSVADAPAEALIPSRTLLAGAAPPESAELVSALAGPVSGAGPAAESDPGAGGTTVPGGGWQGLSALLLALWAATAFGWWRSRRRAQEAAQEDTRAPAMARARRALGAACSGGRAAEARDAVLEWAADAWPETPPLSLGEAARRVGPRLAARLRELDRTLYAPEAQAWDGRALWREAKTELPRRARPSRSAARRGLPPLYPER